MCSVKIFSQTDYTDNSLQEVMAMRIVADNERILLEYVQLKENIQSTTQYSTGNQTSSQASPAVTQKAHTQLWELLGLTCCPFAPMGLTILC